MASFEARRAQAYAHRERGESVTNTEAGLLVCVAVVVVPVTALVGAFKLGRASVRR